MTQPLHQESMLNCAHVHEYEAEAARLCAFLDLECLESHAKALFVPHLCQPTMLGLLGPTSKILHEPQLAVFINFQGFPETATAFPWFQWCRGGGISRPGGCNHEGNKRFCRTLKGTPLVCLDCWPFEGSVQPKKVGFSILEFFSKSNYRICIVKIDQG